MKKKEFGQQLFVLWQNTLHSCQKIRYTVTMKIGEVHVILLFEGIISLFFLLLLFSWFIFRNFFPVTCQSICSANTKPEIKTSAIETLRMIQSYSSDYIGNWTDSPLYKEEIKRLLLWIDWYLFIELINDYWIVQSVSEWVNEWCIDIEWWGWGIARAKKRYFYLLLLFLLLFVFVEVIF